MPSEGFTTYTTADLTLAAFVKAHKIELLASRREGGRTFFVFRGGQETDEIVSQYFANGPVLVGNFRNAWNDLKNIIFQPNSSTEGEGEL